MRNIRRRVHILLGQVVGPPLDWFADHLDDEQAWKLYLVLPRLLFWQPRLARDADRDFSKVLLRRLQLFQQCEFKELEEQFQRAERDIKQPKPTLAEVAAEEDTQDAAAVDPLFNKVGKVVRSGNLSKAARLLGDDKGVADVDADVLAILRGKHPAG